jgi:superfamily II DNA or RNA helicase
MADINVIKINEVFVRVITEQDHINEEIHDFFTFMTPGHESNPRFRKHQWDGKTHLFNSRTRYLYAGLVRYLITFATTQKYSITFEAGIGMMNPVSLVETTDFIDSLKICHQGSVLAPRDYQVVGVAKSLRYKRMLLVSPTASGKSYIMYAIVRWLLDKGLCKKGLIVVPNVHLVKQLKTDFEDYSNGTWDVSENVHHVHQGIIKTIDKPITISTWQSLFDEDPKFFTDFDFVIGDEAHHYKAVSLKTLMVKLVNAEYRISMTGTLNNWKVHRLIIEGLFGPYSKLTTTRKMIDKKQSSDLQIKCLILRHEPHLCDIFAKTKKKEVYRKEIDYLIGCDTRNRFITNLALSLNGNTLLLFQYVEKHGEILYGMLKDCVGRKVFYIHGAVEADDREVVREIVEKETNAIIVASYGTMSEGVNIRNLNNLIFASPSKSKIRVLQSIGRGLRLGDNKTHTTLYDISDDLRVDTYINHTLKHFLERVKIYKSEDFKISNYNIELKE